MDLVQKLIEDYDSLMKKYGYRDNSYNGKINTIIRSSISSFVNKCSNPAIWCYGKHTKMLMADFVYDLKSIKFIIDENLKNQKNNGFQFIGSEDVLSLKIDGVIISSYKFKKEIHDIIQSRYPQIQVLDIYEELQRQGIDLETEYYNAGHPYQLLQQFNNYALEYYANPNGVVAVNIQEILLNMKDFYLAYKWACRFQENSIGNWEEYSKEVYSLYELELSCVKSINSNNVVMFCIDGLRYRDIKDMPGFNDYLSGNTTFYTNAYSVSTSTFESLIPAYGKYEDLSIGYYNDNIVKRNECEFINVAKSQNRKIYFYTDSFKFIDDETIKVTQEAQTATQKLWDFIIDANREGNGLFYIHILYESHYSYPNPYTETSIIADGSNIVFDFLERNGGCLRTDYEKQHKDTLRYLDDTLTPFIKNLDCGIVYYADHGNVIFPIDSKLEDISYPEHTFCQDLIRIPLAIKTNSGIAIKTDDVLCSLFSVNDIIVALLNKEKYKMPKKPYIKLMRSALYNPDFKYILSKLGYERGLLAFEVFVFEDGYKLVVYEDEIKELYSINDEIVADVSVVCEKIRAIYDDSYIC